MPPVQVTVEFVIASTVAAILFLVLIRTWWRARKERKRFRAIVSVDEEVARLRQECGRLEGDRSELGRQYEAEKAAHEKRVVDLQTAYSGAKDTYDRLAAAVRQLEDDIESIDVGLYRPHFDFEDAESYKRALLACRDEVKLAIKQGSAITWGAAWTVEGSSSKGERMQRQYGNLMLRAFNGECEAAIAAVSWNNVTKMEARLQKDFDAINKLGTVMKVELNAFYLGLRLRELRLVYEHARKKQEQAEEQRRIREQMREEERVQRELERAKQEAEADERRYQKALERARDELARAKGAELLEMGERVRELEQSLAEAHARGERAISQAQMTKSGHVYVISNIGSFGSDVFKIGMTRRLDPLERVKELGDASVPFGFDVHAMIHSDDAPALEAQLHRQFAEARINLVNHRKEFFRVQLAQIVSFGDSLGLKTEMTLVAEAQEYRESEVRRTASTTQTAEPARTDVFPARIA